MNLIFNSCYILSLVTLITSICNRQPAPNCIAKYYINAICEHTSIYISISSSSHMSSCPSSLEPPVKTGWMDICLELNSSPSILTNWLLHRHWMWVGASPSPLSPDTFISSIHCSSRVCWFVFPRALQSVLLPSSVYSLSHWVLSLLRGLGLIEASSWVPLPGNWCLFCPHFTRQFSWALFNVICSLLSPLFLPEVLLCSALMGKYRFLM